MIVREKFTAKEWRRAFEKHSKLGYPSDDDEEFTDYPNEFAVNKNLDVKEGGNYIARN